MIMMMAFDPSACPQSAKQESVTAPKQKGPESSKNGLELFQLLNTRCFVKVTASAFHDDKTVSLNWDSKRRA